MTQIRRRVVWLATLAMLLVYSLASAGQQQPVGGHQSWLQEQLTLPNLVLIATFLFYLGVTYQELRDHNKRLAILEEWRDARAEYLDRTYARREWVQRIDDDLKTLRQ